MSSPLASINWDSSQPDLEVTYRFYEGGTEVEGEDGAITTVAPTSFFQAQTLALFQAIMSATNLIFTEGSGNTDIKLLLTDELDEETDGYMGPPGEDLAGLGVFKNVDDEKFETGAYNYMVIVHELMHGLGLAHPHDDGGNSEIMEGVSDSFDDFGDFDLNQGVFTVMTYNNGYPQVAAAPDSGLFGYEVGPMALDIAVLQDKYGVNTDHATGDDSYTLVGENGVGTGWMSIWDADGTDIVEYDGELDANIDLRPATLEYGVGGGGFVSSVDGISGGFTIANGVVIENASGGSGNDYLYGNSAANDLRGTAGNDTLEGAEGDDVLGGGVGHDVLSGGDGADSLNGYRGADSLTGGNDDDMLRGGNGADLLKGGAGADVLGGGRGADVLNGGAGNDILKGSKGSDIINGGEGADTLNGGLGADIFVFTSVEDGDMINDFNSGIDRIDLTGLETNAQIEQQDSGNFVILLDTNGDGQFDDGLILSLQVVVFDDLSL